MDKKMVLRVLGLIVVLFSSLMIASPARALDWSKISDSTIEDYGGVSNLLSFDGKLYVSIDYRVFEYDGNSWDLLYTSSDGQIRSMEDYAGDIYIGVDSGSWGVGAKVYKYDGSSWNQINEDGFGNPENYEIKALAVFDNKLYAGTTKGDSTGLEVWEYDGTDWTQVGSNGINDADNASVEQMTAHNGRLYLTTSNSDTGTQVLEYDGSSWDQVNVGGFGDVNDYGAQSIISYDGKLYVGTNQRGRVWEFDGDDWAQVNSDRFGVLGNVLVNSFEVYDDKLYASTFNESIGMQIWEYDGNGWNQANESGFGNSVNALGGVGRWLEIYDDKIYAVVAEWDCEGSCHYQNTGIWSAQSPNLIDDEEDEDDSDDEIQKARIISWKAEKYETLTKNSKIKVKVEINGKRFAKRAKVKIGGKEAEKVERKTSKKIIAWFDWDELMKKYDSERTLTVKNPGADTTKGMKKIDLKKIDWKIEPIDFNPETILGVLNIQKMLFNLDLLVEENINGTYGPITTEAVRKFQADNGLPQTGFVGPLTRAKMEELK